MKLMRNHTCPLCKSSSTPKLEYPYATTYNKVCFSYIKCDGCGVVFVDPIPDKETFTKMYAKADYHDCYYQDKESGEYLASTKLLKQYLPEGASVLDYGCGIGEFLKELKKEGFVPYGVEFDKDAANSASQSAGCDVISVDDFQAQTVKPMFDAIHFGDVLEHLPDPAKTFKELLAYLKPSGILYVEGPLEINPSLVYWASRLFGAFRRLVRPTFVGQHPPNHLFRTGARQQLAFFFRVEPRLVLKYWKINETGWPYAEGGVVKRAIAGVAVRVGGKKLFGMTFGNRFRGVFTLPGTSSIAAQATSVQ